MVFRFAGYIIHAIPISTFMESLQKQISLIPAFVSTQQTVRTAVISGINVRSTTFILYLEFNFFAFLHLHYSLIHSYAGRSKVFVIETEKYIQL